MTRDKPTMSAAPGVLGDVAEVVRLACRAPSIHNTQPWRWRVSGHRVELSADPTRRLEVADPDGRNVLLSCGAALHHAQVAAAGLGWAVATERLPDLGRADLLAVLTLTPDRVRPQDAQRLEDLRRRVTDRRRFTSWPLPEERLQRLAEDASEWGALVLPLTDPDTRRHVDRILRRAEEHQRTDERHAAEAAAWVGTTGPDGVPHSSIPEVNPHRPAMPSRYRVGTLADPRGDPVETVDGLVAICTADDAPLSLVRAGETLSALWLAAVHRGLALLPLSQVTEVPETREELRRVLPGDRLLPQLLVRIGWQEATRPELPPTPRRPVGEVLDRG